MIQLPSEFRASLETFRGPLDLLLYLIKKEEVDILDIPVSRITEQYILYLQILKDLEPNICGEFLVMAAKLMEIKSRTLLPVEVVEEEDEEYEDPRLELVLQLLEYKRYKERSMVLEEMAERQSQRFRRPEADISSIPGADEPSFDLSRVSVWDLLTAFQRVQMALAMRQPHKVLFEDRPIEEYIDLIEQHIESSDEKQVTFDTLFETCQSRYDAVGYFIAILEMAKSGMILFSQLESFGNIVIRRRPEGELEQESEEFTAEELEGKIDVEAIEAVSKPRFEMDRSGWFDPEANRVHDSKDIMEEIIERAKAREEEEELNDDDYDDDYEDDEEFEEEEEKSDEVPSFSSEDEFEEDDEDDDDYEDEDFEDDDDLDEDEDDDDWEVVDDEEDEEETEEDLDDEPEDKEHDYDEEDDDDDEDWEEDDDEEWDEDDDPEDDDE